MLQMVSGETLPIFKDVFLTLTLVQHPLKICVSVANITNELILQLDILPAYDASVDLGGKMRPSEKRYHYEAPGRSPAFQPGSDQCSSDTCTMRGSGDGSIAEAPPEVKHGLVELSPDVNPPLGPGPWSETAREGPERYLSRPKLTKQCPLAHCEPVTPVAPPNVE